MLFNAITKIFTLVPIILVISIYLKHNYLEKKKKIKLIICISFIFAIISVIFECINIFKIGELDNSSDDIFKEIENKYESNIPEIISNEKNHLEDWKVASSIMIGLYIIFIFILIVVKCLIEGENLILKKNPDESEKLLNIKEEEDDD